MSGGQTLTVEEADEAVDGRKAVVISIFQGMNTVKVHSFKLIHVGTAIFILGRGFSTLIDSLGGTKSKHLVIKGSIRNFGNENTIMNVIPTIRRNPVIDVSMQWELTAPEFALCLGDNSTFVIQVGGFSSNRQHHRF